MEETPTYIAIEGPIGVGKTTLTRMLVDYLEARGVFEEFEENPFLRKFYDDRRSVAFQTQIFFLFSRFKQQQTLRQGDLFATHLVTDYLFAKDRIFAYLNLNDDELSLYDKIFELLNPKIRKPDLVVHLTAPLDTLLRRIRARGRDYEKTIEPDYLRDLASAYHRFFQTYREVPVITVDTAGIDVVGSVEDRLELLEKVVRSVPAWRDKAPLEGRAGTRAGSDAEDDELFN